MKKNWLITNFLIGFILVISAISYFPNFKSSAAGCGSNTFIVQCTAASTNGTIANSGTTSTLSSPITAGDSLIIVGGFSSGNTQNTVLQCSDTLSQTFTVAVHQNQHPNSGIAQDSTICFVQNSLSGSDAGTVTASSAAQGTIVVAIYEVTPALQFTGIEITNVCLNGAASVCIDGGGAPPNLANPGWHMNNNNASLVLTVLGGNPIGGDDEIIATGFDRIDTSNGNSPGATNLTQIIAQGGGGIISDSGTPATGHWFSGVMAAFGPFTVTATSTITGFLVPNFVNGVNSFSWLYFLIVVMVPMAEIIGVITMDRSALLDRHAIIFIFLSLLLLDSIFGVMLNVVTVAMPFIFGTLFGLYLWRGRG